MTTERLQILCANLMKEIGQHSSTCEDPHCEISMSALGELHAFVRDVPQAARFYQDLMEIGKCIE